MEHAELLDKSVTLMFLKQAEAQPHGGFGVQQYLPPTIRRDLSEDEEDSIKRRQRMPIPKIFKSDRDPITADMSSKGWSAAGGGLLGALLGGVGGGILGGSAAIEPGGMTPEQGQNIGAGIGGLSVGALLALIAWHNRKAENETLEERIRRLPEGANRRDMKSDPVYQAEQNREAQLAAAAAIAAR